MDITEFDRDETLTEFLSDYIDGTLNHAERQSFEEYLDQNEKEQNFARKAMKGKKALSRLADHMNNISSKKEKFASLTAATDMG
jgi:anti-sigma factor RsiW